MTARPDIAAQLAEGETLLWQGHPTPGRRVPLRASIAGIVFFAAAIGLVLLAGWVEIYHGHELAWRLAVYLMVTTAAFCTYLGLRLTVLDRRRARARDARTAYAITDRRALVLAGPYRADVALGPGVTVDHSGDTLVIGGSDSGVRFDRLDDAGAARDILMARTGGTA